MSSPLIVVNVNEIYQAKKDLLNKAAEFHVCLKTMNYSKGYDIRQEMNLIKRTIKNKYQIIL